MLLATKIVTGAIFAFMAVAAVWCLYLGRYEVGVVAGLISAAFGVFVYHDVKKALKK